MVNDILDSSKIEADKMALHLETLDIDKLIDEVEATARPLAAKNTNSFVVERGSDLGSMRADATKLRQAIFNLLSNAAKFTQNGQKLTIIAEGVETREQAEFLSDIACHQLQGFYFARPLDHIDLPHYLLTHVVPRAPVLKAEAEAKLQGLGG